MTKKIDLLFLPFAGGSRYSYAPLEKHFSADFNFIPLEYPGRGMRMNERLLFDLDSIALDLFDKIRADMSGRYAIYGHSMGAIVGFLLLRLIAENNIPLPICIFVSGRACPLAPNHEKTYLLSREEFWNKIVEYGGCSVEVLKDESLKQLFEPILRADVCAVEEYTYVSKREPYDTPLIAMIGTRERVKREDALLWKHMTKSKFTLYEFEGDHFFPFSHSEKIARLIESYCLAKRPL